MIEEDGENGDTKLIPTQSSFQLTWGLVYSSG